MIITDQPIYNGPFIHQRFAYKYFRKNTSPCGDIVSFIAPAIVEAAGMIDTEDILAKDYIYSEKMINFCWEIPLITDCFGAVAFQRLFNSGIANILSKYLLNKIPTAASAVMVDGDDIMVAIHGSQEPKKASVSITYMAPGAAIGHTGININAGSKAPEHVYSTNFGEEVAMEFIKEVENYFTWVTRDMFIATTKITVSK